MHLVDTGGSSLVPHSTIGRFQELPPIVFKRGEGLAGRVWQKARAQHVDDYKHWEGRLQGVDLSFAAGAIAAPLASRGGPLGVIALARDRADDRRPFGAEDQDLLGRFAQLAGIALEQVLLIQEIEARRRESDQLSRIATAMQEPASLQERMDLVLQAVQEVVGFERAVLWLPDAQATALVTTSWIGFDGPVGEPPRVPLDGSVPLLESAFRRKREIVVDEAGAVPAAKRAAAHLADHKLLRSRAPAVLPLVSRGRAVGVLAVDNPYSRRPLADNLPALRRLVPSVAVAIDSARLYEEVQAELVERRAAEAELRRSEEKYRTILETIQDAYFEADRHGVLQLVNPAFVAGVGAGSLGEVMGQPYRRFADPRDVRELMETFRGVLRSGEPQQRREFRFRRRDGGTFHGEMSIGPVLDEAGEVTGFRGLVRDVSDRKRYEAELHEAKDVAEAANASKSTFLANVSHELRTPLTSILGFARLIERRFDEVVVPGLAGHDDPKVLRALQQARTNAGIIFSESQRLTHLINDVLDLAKIEAGRVDWRMAPLALGEVVDRAVQATTGLFEQKSGVRMLVDASVDVPVLLGDRDRLTQVVINLISNAVKFTASGDVAITVAPWEDEEVGTSVVVRVRDTGIGIAPEDHATVFEQFRQVGDTLTDKPRGTGLGLPICRQIVEHHGGRLWLESAVGSGSTFSFALPLEPPERVRLAAAAAPPSAADVAPVPAAAASAPAARGVRATVGAAPIAEPRPAHAITKATRLALRRRVAALVRRTSPTTALEGGFVEGGTIVLVVDDDARVRSLLRQELEEAGHSVLEAGDGRAALEAVRRHRPDLVVLDVMLPGLNGFDVAATLKSDPETMRTPIVILSVVQEPERARRLGVEGYFTKPVDVRALLDEVDALLRAVTVGVRLALVDPIHAERELPGAPERPDRTPVEPVVAVLERAGFLVERLPSAGAVIVALQRRPGARPEVLVASATVVRTGDLSGPLREAGVPVVLWP